MSNFAFPPPPPPPKASGSDSQGQHPTNGFYRGDRGSRGAYVSHSFRGRGSNQRGGPPYRGRGAIHGAHNHGSHSVSNNLAAGVKRKSDAHRGSSNVSQSQPGSRYPQMSVAPAVPTFGFQLPPSSPPALAPRQSSPTVQSSKDKKQRKHNVLGLTPKGAEREDSDEDMDEEAKAAATALAYAQNPSLPNLRSHKEVATWLEQRRRRYPTRARADQIRQAELDRLKQKVVESQKAKAVEGSKHKDAGDKKLQVQLDKHMRKAERLRGKLLQSKASGTMAQDRPSSDTTPKAAASVPGLGLNYSSDSDNSAGHLEDSAGEIDSSDESSAGSSEAGSVTSSSSTEPGADEAPEVASSKPYPPIVVRKQSTIPDYLVPHIRAGVCKFLLLKGFCKNEKTGACRRKHVLPKQLREYRGERPRLYDRLVEQEKRKENTLALQAIKALGDAGFFKDVL